MGIRTVAHFSPGRIILFSFFLTIGIGTFLLWLPIARTTYIPIIDLFFTATSATCVTGLFTLPLDQFTLFGHAVMLALIQIGGLGLITMTLFLLTLFIDLGMATQLMAGQLLEFESWTKIRQFLLFIIGLTVTIELLGALGIFLALQANIPLSTRSFLAIFHAVSSFCNAGISLLPLYGHSYLANHGILLITMALVMCGSLGFITWLEIGKAFQAHYHKKRYSFSLSSKIVLYWTVPLIVIFGIIFWILEHDNVLKGMSGFTMTITTLFHAITLRSSGFLIYQPENLHIATLCAVLVLAFIGSSPGSTGSGIKITTFATLLSMINAAITEKHTVEMKGRQIPIDQVYKAITIFILSICWIFLTTFCLLITEKNPHFFDIFFEVGSAFTTLGITTGLSKELSTIGKLFIICSMIVGRIGSVTLVLALRTKRATDQSGIRYPEERIMLG